MAQLNPLRYGKVVGRFLANISDGPDIDDLPEFLPLSGTVTFKAAPSKILVAEGEPDPATVVQLPEHYVASLDQFGYLTWRNQRGVRLISPDGYTNPTGWTWTVSFDLSYDGSKVPMAPYAFEVPEYIPGPDPENPDEDSIGLVDLALVSPVPASNGEAVVRGLSVVDVDLVGTALVFRLDNGESLDPVEIPQIEAAQDAANAAAASEEAAETAKAQAETIVNSFDLTVGTVTTGDPGDPASVTISGGPEFVLDAVLPKGDTGDPGPPAPDATGSTKGILQFGGVLAGSTATSQTLADDSVTEAMIADNSVTAAQIAANAVGSSELADNAVDTNAIQNLAVTGAKIANDTITSAQIAADAVGSSELADNAVDTNALAALAVTAAKIASGAITDTQISASAGIAVSKLGTGRVQASKNGTATSITLWFGTEAQYNTATSSGASEDPNTVYFRSA